MGGVGRRRHGLGIFSFPALGFCCCIEHLLFLVLVFWLFLFMSVPRKVLVLFLVWRLLFPFSFLNLS